MPRAASSAELDARLARFDAAWDCLEQDDLDGFMAIVREEVHDSVEFESGIGSVVGGRSYKGAEGIREWFSDLLENSSARRWMERRYEPIGDESIVFFGTLWFEGAASRVPVESETGAVFQYRDGRCIRINSFMTHAEAREFAEAMDA
jgi:hypothetical protein